jgi:hypothetical protein
MHDVFPSKKGAEEFLRGAAPEVELFWAGDGDAAWGASHLLPHADYIYSRALLGTASRVSPTAAQRFAATLADSPIAGRCGCDKSLSPHLSAYLLGALNLLAAAGHDYRAMVLGAIEIDVDRLVDSRTTLPRWPPKWSHHVWRVSHWIGGIPAILLSFARHGSRSVISESFVRSVLEACDRSLLADDTGLMRPYRSNLLQGLFRAAYRLRHDPVLADIGGLAHIHWVNHAVGRPYKAAPFIIERCFNDMKPRPFLEKVPYCLDFDYVQLLRTAIEQCPEMRSEAIVERVRAYAEDVGKFLTAIPGRDYALHKLPGALATLHEATFVLKLETVPGVGCPPVDVIKAAYWL